MAAPKTSPGDAPGASAVEALASPTLAKLLHDTIAEAAGALREQWTTADGQAGARPLRAREETELDALTSLGKQLVTATTPTPGGGS